MKQRMIYAALAVLAFSVPAGAEPIRLAQAYEAGALPPHEILTILRSTGLDPLGQPVRRGPNYVLRAVDDSDREVSVVVSARSGSVLSVTPVATPSRAPLGPPPRGGVSMGPYERMPPGYIPPGPRGGYDAGLADDDDDLPPPRSYGSRPPLAAPGTPPSISPRSTTNAAPLPRGGAMQPDDETSPSAGPNVITADPDRSGMLPPPPERFPQRVAPTSPKPKPVTRAAAAPPKQAPLPKPKPGSSVEGSPPAAAAPPPAAAPEPEPQPSGAAVPH